MASIMDLLMTPNRAGSVLPTAKAGREAVFYAGQTSLSLDSSHGGFYIETTLRSATEYDQKLEPAASGSSGTCAGQGRTSPG